MQKPEGKHFFGGVKVGEKGQIVIPVEARKVFNIKPGDTLFVLGDEAQGIAIVKQERFNGLVNGILNGIVPDKK